MREYPSEREVTKHKLLCSKVYCWFAFENALFWKLSYWPDRKTLKPYHSPPEMNAFDFGHVQSRDLNGDVDDASDAMSQDFVHRHCRRRRQKQRLWDLRDLWGVGRGSTVVQNSQESSIRLFARTAHSIACSAQLASLARSTALIHLFGRSLTHSLPSSWLSVWFDVSKWPTIWRLGVCFDNCYYTFRNLEHGNTTFLHMRDQTNHLIWKIRQLK